VDRLVDIFLYPKLINLGNFLLIIESEVVHISTLSTFFDPGFGPLDENVAANGAGTFSSWLLYITADGDLS
jgi:hypothetical protein